MTCELHTRPVQGAERGEHLCGLHSDPDGRARLVQAFAAAALGAGDRLLYLCAHADGRTRVGRTLEGAVPDAAAMLRNGQIVVLRPRPADAPDAGRLPQRMAAMLRTQADRARADGYPGLRVTAEMDGVLERCGSVDELLRLEHLCADQMRRCGIIGLCQYGRPAIRAATLARIAAAHSGVARDDGRRPLALLVTVAHGGGLRVEGEVDRSNAHLLAAALRSRAAVEDPLCVDLSALGFVDLSGIRAIREVADEGDVRILVAGMSATGRRIADLAGEWSANVEVVR